MGNKKILYFVAEDWYFVSHRLSLALEAKKRGYEVIVLTRVKEHGNDILSNDLKLINLDLKRHGTNILSEILTLLRIYRIYKSENPGILHHIALKPVLYGTICGLITQKDIVVNTLPGMGYLFESSLLKHRIYSWVILNVLRILFSFKSVSLIVQNQEIYEMFLKKKIINLNKIYLIKGSGVDINNFKIIQPEKIKTPIVLFASRLLWQKGIKDFVNAAKIIKKRNKKIKFIIVGKPDEENPNSVDESILKKWQEDGDIEWWGYRKDMPYVILNSNIVCLPSFYGEGVPKILLEAAACGKPIITTDTPGCRDIVRDKINGYLVPTHSPEKIAEKIDILINNKELCEKMGQQGKRIVEENYLIEKINKETIHVYQEQLNKVSINHSSGM